MKSIFLCLILAMAAPAQQKGVESQWDIGQTLKAISAHALRVKSVLDQVQPKQWVAKGAPEAYIGQWNSTRTQAQGLSTVAEMLSRDPEKLTAALDMLFRLQTLDSLLSSLTEGVRKYQNPATADLLSGVISENGANRQRLQQYVTDLAALKEQEFKVVDQEAQRCRASLLKQPKR
jgi:hypothetical protein